MNIHTLREAFACRYMLKYIYIEREKAVKWKKFYRPHFHKSTFHSSVPWMLPHHIMLRNFPFLQTSYRPKFIDRFFCVLRPCTRGNDNITATTTQLSMKPPPFPTTSACVNTHAHRSYATTIQLPTHTITPVEPYSAAGVYVATEPKVCTLIRV